MVPMATIIGEIASIKTPIRNEAALANGVCPLTVQKHHGEQEGGNKDGNLTHDLPFPSTGDNFEQCTPPPDRVTNIVKQ